MNKSRADVALLARFLTHGWPAARRGARLSVAVPLVLLSVISVGVAVNGAALFIAIGNVLGTLALLLCVLMLAAVPISLIAPAADYVRALVGGPVYCSDCSREVTCAPRHRCQERK